MQEGDAAGHRGQLRRRRARAAKLERRRIADRTARGRADAKAKGIKFGRKPTLTPHQRQEARETPRRRRDTAQRCPQLQRQSEHDFPPRPLT